MVVFICIFVYVKLKENDMINESKTHWKKAFKSDYLSSSDIEEKDLVLTIEKVVYKECVTASGKKFCNVAIFTDTKLDHNGKHLSGTKPMILNVGNSKIVKKFSGNKVHLEEWVNIKIRVYVDSKVKFGSDTVEGLRIRETQPQNTKPLLTKENATVYANAVNYYKENKHFSAIEERYTLSEEIKEQIKTDSNVN